MFPDYSGHVPDCDIGQQRLESYTQGNGDGQLNMILDAMGRGLGCFGTTPKMLNNRFVNLHGEGWEYYFPRMTLLEYAHADSRFKLDGEWIWWYSEYTKKRNSNIGPVWNSRL